MEKVTMAIIFQHKKIKGNLWQIYDSDNEFSKLIVNEEIVSNHKNFILK